MPKKSAAQPAKIDCCVKTLHKAPTLTVPEAMLVGKIFNSMKLLYFSTRATGIREATQFPSRGGREQGGTKTATNDREVWVRTGRGEFEQRC